MSPKLGSYDLLCYSKVKLKNKELNVEVGVSAENKANGCKYTHY